MTVAELMIKLKTQKPSAKVFVGKDDHICELDTVVESSVFVEDVAGWQDTFYSKCSVNLAKRLNKGLISDSFGELVKVDDLVEGIVILPRGEV